MLTTKTFNPMSEGADSGLSRDRIRRQLDSSLSRLGIDARRPLSRARDGSLDAGGGDDCAFDELAEAGTIGAWGGSNVDAAWIEEASGTAPAWVQNSYSLLERADERDVLQVCAREGSATRRSARLPAAG